MTVPPSHAYYRLMDGRWSGALRFSITGWRAFLASPMGRIERLQVIAMAVATRVLGPVTMSTTLDATGVEAGLVRHTTAVSRWGQALMRGEERFTLDPDGRRFRFHGVFRTWPFVGPEQDYGDDAAGEVDASAQGASYELPWCGVRLRQTTRVVPEGLLVIQLTPWSRAVVTLRRHGPR